MKLFGWGSPGVIEAIMAIGEQDRRAAAEQHAATLAATVPRAVHEAVVVQYERQLASLELQRKQSVAREVHTSIVGSLNRQLARQAEDHDAALAQLTRTLDITASALERAQAQTSSAVTEAFAIKRNAEGMHPADFDAHAGDPETGLGPRTLLAVEDWAGGDPERRKYLLHYAHTHLGLVLADAQNDREAADVTLAQMILDGDS